MNHNDRIKAYRRTLGGRIPVIYSNLCLKAAREQTPVRFTAQELRKWAESDEAFLRLYENWAENGYPRTLSPNIARVDDAKEWTLDNIRAVTAHENLSAAKKGRRVPVLQLSMEGELLNEYPSIAAAADALGCNPLGITHVLHGRAKSAHGYRWIRA